MRRILQGLTALAIALSAQTASAGQILVIEAFGNFYNSNAGNWNPDHPDTDEYRKMAFTETFMYDLDSCALTKTGGSCSRMRATVSTQFYQSYNFDSGWITPLNGPISFTISNTEIRATDRPIRYIDKPMPVDWPYPDVWGMILYFDLYGNWNVNFNDVSELLGQKLRVFQSDEGFSPNASFMPYNYEGGPVNDTILESGFEFVEISVIPEPSSVALMGLAAAGLAFARRRKV